MGLLAITVSHLVDYVLPAVAEYEGAEVSLSRAYDAGEWSEEAKNARRKAAEVAVAIDGLADRSQRELNLSLDTIRKGVAPLSVWPASAEPRIEAFERMHGVANAYKHSRLDKPSHVLRSFDDVLVVGLGFGLDGFGVGKMGGIEVLVKDKQHRYWKFLGDVPVVLNAWCCYLASQGAILPRTCRRVCGIEMSI